MHPLKVPYSLVTLLAVITPGAAHASADQASTGGTSNSQPIVGTDRREIVVIANPPVISVLGDLLPDQSYDSDRVASYAVNTVGEAIDQIAAANGDERPALLVNGQPIEDRKAIENYPAEAISHIDLLPRGAAQRIGGMPGQRVYNIVLRTRVTSLTTTFGQKLATEGHWREEDGEVLLTRIRDASRFNLSLKVGSSGLLRESDRGVVQPQQEQPYNPIGNIIPASGFAGEIDPKLSALVGFPVSVAAVPANNLRPILGDFIAGANQPNTIDLGRYRSLLQASQNYEASLAWTRQIEPWLTASLNGSLEWGNSHGLDGLPSSLFLVGADNADTPFSRDVLLARSDAIHPLQVRSRSVGGSLSLNFAANFGQWRASLSGGYSNRTVEYRNDVVPSSALSGPIVLGSESNPFDPSLGSLIPVSIELSRSHTTRYETQASIEGPVFALPGGDVRIHASVLAGHSTLTPTGTFGGSRLSRTDVTEKAGITIPIANGKRALSRLGDLELSFDFARAELSDYSSLDSLSWTLSWQLRRWLRVNGGFARTRNPVDLGLLAAPVRVYQNVRTFDPVRAETVDVTYVSGGDATLRPETDDVYRVTLSVAPLPRYDLQFWTEYTSKRIHDQIGAVTTASAVVMSAFPDRFIRDASGQLISVDGRPVNFRNLDEKSLRYGFSFVIPLFRASNPSTRSAQEAGNQSAAAQKLADFPRPRIEANFSHTILLDSTAVLQGGLPPLDLLSGGAIDAGGGRPRHMINGVLSLTDRGTGIRLVSSWRSPTSLLVGVGGAGGSLRFGALATFDLTVFADMQRLFPGRTWAANGRISIAVTNIANARQRVTDSSGLTPIGYQPAYLDAVGRTVRLELRKTF